MMPVSTSTLSLCTSLSASCTAMSGLRWSSSTITSMSAPAWLTASMKPSRTSTPRAAPPPERVVIMPTLRVSAWAAVASAIAATAAVNRLSGFLMGLGLLWCVFVLSVKGEITRPR